MLEDFKVLLTVYLFGNANESQNLLDQVESKQYDYLYGRFFTQKFIFRGITSKAELRKFISCYDALRHPAITGPTYTEHFLPDAVAEGFKLEDLTDLIWKTYTAMVRPSRHSSWGMRYFTSTMAFLLGVYLCKHGVEKANEEMIERCIEASGLPTKNRGADHE